MGGKLREVKSPQNMVYNFFSKYNPGFDKLSEAPVTAVKKRLRGYYFEIKFPASLQHQPAPLRTRLFVFLKAHVILFIIK